MTLALDRLRALRATALPSATTRGTQVIPVSSVPSLAELPADRQLEFEERAAVREYDGGQPREYAEAEALRETVERMRATGEIPTRKAEST